MKRKNKDGKETVFINKKDVAPEAHKDAILASMLADIMISTDDAIQEMKKEIELLKGSGN